MSATTTKVDNPSWNTIRKPVHPLDNNCVAKDISNTRADICSATAFDPDPHPDPNADLDPDKQSRPM